MSYIEFNNVKKIYKMGDVKIKALAGASFTIEKGEFAVIAGPSGAGKSTILNLLGGMDTATTGEIIVDGQRVNEMDAKQLTAYRRYDIGFVFQFYNLVQNLTARENVELAAQICKDPLDIDKTLDAVGLSDRKKNEYCLEHNIPLIRIPYTRFNELVIQDLIPASSAFLVSAEQRP